MYCKCGHDHRWGYTLQGGMLSKSVSSSKHLLHSPPAWSIQKGIILFHLGRGDLRSILIRDRENNKDYYCSIKTFMWSGKRLDLGHGEQLALDLEFWQVM